MAEETVANTGISGVNSGDNANAETTSVNVEGNGVQTETNTETQAVDKGVDTNEPTPAIDLSAIKLPAGMSVSDEDKAKFSTIVDKIGFKDQAALQAFVDWSIETAVEENARKQKQADADAEASKKEWEEIKSGWKKSLESDADFGKEYDLNMKRANDAIVKFGGAELTTLLKDTDFAGHPVIIKTFARIGKEIEDARLLSGAKTVETNKRQVDRYNQPMLVYND